jgi:hypothetical protein
MTWKEKAQCSEIGIHFPLYFSRIPATKGKKITMGASQILSRGELGVSENSRGSPNLT